MKSSRGGGRENVRSRAPKEKGRAYRALLCAGAQLWESVAMARSVRSLARLLHGALRHPAPAPLQHAAPALASSSRHLRFMSSDHTAKWMQVRRSCPVDRSHVGRCSISLHCHNSTEYFRVLWRFVEALGNPNLTSPDRSRVGPALDYLPSWPVVVTAMSLAQLP